jgi:hypothetical protein
MRRNAFGVARHRRITASPLVRFAGAAKLSALVPAMRAADRSPLTWTGRLPAPVEGRRATPVPKVPVQRRLLVMRIF